MAGGRTVLVTGGTGALGRGVTAALLDRGFHVVATWVVERERDVVEAELGGRCRLRRLDVTDLEAVLVVAQELGEGGGPWGLAHLVGGYREGDPVAGMDLRDWDRQMELNLRTSANVLRGFLPGMVERGGGRVVAVGSRAAVRPFAGAAAYAASKAGLIALVGAASEEVKHDGVCVNCVLPSVIDTPANRRATPAADFARWVRPREIGEVVAFLCSPEASAVTGAAVPVYGRA